jgi:nucleotidyltransferase AbiEii toxin of type IV toxin-antitoxin system
VAAVARAAEIVLEGVPLRVIGRGDLMHEKLRAAADPGRPRSKRLQDLADAQALLEADPAAAAELTEQEKATLNLLP